MDSKFSHDMFMEIVSRTSLKTLDTLRCISKDFEKLTYDPYLLNLHKQRNNIVSGFLVLNCRNFFEFTNDFAPAPESNSLDLGFLPDNAKILASSAQGLMVFESPHPRSNSFRYHVCKPATKQVLELPNPKLKYLTKKVAMIVMGSKPLHYKIVRLSEPKRTNKWYELWYDQLSYRCEIFDSKTWAWRRQKDLLILHDPCVFYKQPITTNGSIYILSYNEILKFDAYSEKWTTFSSPVEDHVGHRKLVKYQGKLGFACMTTETNLPPYWEIWVFTIGESWEKLRVADPNMVYNLEAIYDSETMVAWEEKITLVFSRFKGGDHISKIKMFKGGHYPIQTFPFRSDFEPVDLRG